MKKGRCPVCERTRFYVKDPADSYETWEFECRDGAACFDPDTDQASAPEVTGGTETYCTWCSWHGSFDKLK